MYFKLFFAIFSTKIIFITCDPIIIRTGISKLDDHARLQHGNLFNTNLESGLINFEAGEGFDKGGEKKYVQAEDEGKFLQENANKNIKLDEANYGAENFHKYGGGEISDLGQRIAHKKGHHKSGFHNSYHKDESGHNSSYFDDSNNEGDEYFYNTKKGQFGDLTNQRKNSGYSTGNAYNKEDARRGQYNNAGQYEKDYGDRKNYNKERFYTDRKQQARNNAAEQYGNTGRQSVEKLYHDPYYNGYNNAYYDYPEDTRITIYEDPAYDNRFDRYRDRYIDDRYYDRRVEVRPSYYHDRYYNKRPNYDYYY